MKRTCLLLFALVLLLLAVTALGEAFSYAPYDIQSQVAAQWGDWKVDDYLNPGNGSTAFVAVHSDGRNDLLCFVYRNGYWSYSWHRKEVLPQEGTPVWLTDRSWSNYAGLNLGTAFSIREQTAGTYETIWEQSGGQWNLRAVVYVDTNGDVIETFQVRNGGILYTGWDANGGSQFVSGSVQDNIHYFVYSVFPKSLSALKNKLSSPPAIPEGMLNATNIKFTGGQRYDVYSGPGVYYYRGGNGKAMVSTNDWIQVFGAEDGWILIQYNISRGHMRFGWIPEDALPSGTYVEDFGIVPIDARTIEYVTLTDDPLNSQSPMFSIPANSPVDWIATMGEWAYIEYNGEELARGFVPISSLSSDMFFELENEPMSDGTPVFSGILSISDQQAEAHIFPYQSGPLANAAVDSIRFYDTINRRSIGILTSKDEEGIWSGTFMVPSTTTSLTIIGADANGNEYSEYEIRVEW